ncbi:ester cyclase [Paraburkholderia sp. BCC1884]|uniref:ester cyclase n=1 Tax=Paraburkholderia sp. BCC1884 TaxID=2562668 RepID=UPI0011836CDF|nr:ester cyclase [Paraburkholderia sp. BCC1884]
MTSLQDANKLVVQRFNKEFIENKDDSVYDELVSTEFHDGGKDKGGPDPFVFFTKIFRPAFPDAKVVIHEQIAEGDQVVTRKSYEGTHSSEFMGVPATGNTVSFEVIEIITVRDGKYVDHSAIPDTMSLLKQLKSTP